jgi:NAD(P)-dependent dehydrogenase (short-subunit alcohol dehydrogenase family)
MPAARLDSAAIARTLAVNLQAPMSACAALVPACWRGAGARSRFVSSVSGYRGLPLAAAYGASKRRA